MANVQTYDLAAIRAALPALADVTYMNSGTEGIMAEPVLKSYLDVLTRFERYGHYARHELVGEFVKARERCAALVNAEPSEVGVTRSGTDGCSFVIGAFDFKPGDQILISDQEHPAILYPAFALQTTAGVEVRIFKLSHDPAETAAAFAAQLTPRTRLAAFSHVSCETGIRVPASELIRLAHDRDVRVLLDGAQTVGSIPVDFRALGCDYLTGSSHKWLCGPKGTGLLVVRQDRLDDLTPRYVGGGSFDQFPHDQLDHPELIKVTFAASASRFEFGMRSPAVYAGLTAAIDYLNEIGFDAIAEHEREMNSLLKHRLATTPGVTVQTPMEWERSSGLLNFRLAGISGQDLSSKLWNDWKIVQRAVREPNGVRLSTAYFSSPADVERVIEAVTEIRSGL
jgi:selenocysteine lyase/cysteine desulfurase